LCERQLFKASEEAISAETRDTTKEDETIFLSNPAQDMVYIKMDGLREGLPATPWNFWIFKGKRVLSQNNKMMKRILCCSSCKGIYVLRR
jgi:hypothetical protein